MDISGLVGNTPILWVPELWSGGERGFWAKLEGYNPGGIKDRAALHMIAEARRRGTLRPGAPIIESTSGTLGLGLALAGVVHGHPVTLVADPGMEPLMRRLLLAYGARLEIVAEPYPEGGWQAARRARVRDLLTRDPDAYCPDQYANPDNVAAYAPLAAELTTQLTHIDILVCSVGTGGHSGGITRALRTRNPALRLVGVDTIGSTIFGQPARSRLMRGLGSSIHPANVAYDAFSEIHWVAPAEAVWACRRLAAARYATGGWSVGAVAMVASWLARREPPGTRIAAVFPDGPERYFDTVYGDAYCAEHGLLDHKPEPEPDELPHPAAWEATRWSRCTTITPPCPAASARPQGSEPRDDAPGPAGHQGKGPRGDGLRGDGLRDDRLRGEGLRDDSPQADLRRDDSPQADLRRDDSPQAGLRRDDGSRAEGAPGGVRAGRGGWWWRGVPGRWGEAGGGWARAGEA